MRGAALVDHGFVLDKMEHIMKNKGFMRYFIKPLHGRGLYDNMLKENTRVSIHHKVLPAGLMMKMTDPAAKQKEETKKWRGYLHEAAFGAGVHFGHQTRRWNPKMAPYIFTDGIGIYIIDLQKTVHKIDRPYNFIKDTVAEGGSILFVGTKKQAQDAIRKKAERCSMFYVNQRWLGGLLTNNKTIRRSVHPGYQTDGSRRHIGALPKKGSFPDERETGKTGKVRRGIKEMKRLPGAILSWIRKERITIAEARKLHIPIVAIVDPNCDPEEVDYVIPGNDDAIRAVKLNIGRMADMIDRLLRWRKRPKRKPAAN